MALSDGKCITDKVWRYTCFPIRVSDVDVGDDSNRDTGCVIRGLDRYDVGVS